MKMYVTFGGAERKEGKEGAIAILILHGRNNSRANLPYLKKEFLDTRLLYGTEFQLDTVILIEIAMCLSTEEINLSWFFLHQAATPPPFILFFFPPSFLQSRRKAALCSSKFCRFCSTSLS